MADLGPLHGKLIRVTPPSHGSGTHWDGPLIGRYDQPTLIILTRDGPVTLPQHFDITDIPAAAPPPPHWMTCPG